MIGWAVQWEVRRVRGLLLRRLPGHRNETLPRALRTTATIAGFIVFALYWWVIIIPWLALAIARGGLSRLRSLLTRRPPPPPRERPPRSPMTAPLTAWITVPLNEYQAPELTHWLPMFIDRRRSTANPGAEVDGPEPVGCHMTSSTVALAYADADRAVAEQLAAGLRAPGIVLVLVDRRADPTPVLAGHDRVVFLLTRFSRRALERLPTPPTILVSFGRVPVPRTVARRHILDLTTRDVPAIVEAVDEALAFGSHRDIGVAPDPRASLLGVPRGVHGYALGYLTMLGFMAFMLLNGMLSVRDFSTIAFPLGVLVLVWLYLLLTRRAPLVVGTAVTIVIMIAAAARIAMSTNDIDHYVVLVVPAVWLYLHRSSGDEVDVLTLWAPRSSFGR